MIDLLRHAFLVIGLSAPLRPGVGQAQMHHGHPATTDTTAHRRPKSVSHPHGRTAHGTVHHGMDMSEMEMGEMPMSGMYGVYAMSREASGTAWQPEAARHEGIHVMHGSWMAMLHGFVDLVMDDQGGRRGDSKIFSDNMLMGMAQRPLGPGTLGLRTMLSAEPATIGKKGYPLLLQTGETVDGRTHLIDRQHPHDLFMELAGSYSLARGTRSVFLYGGLPGEPALGPPAFMHRYSGTNLPVAPITHHWLDSTHITFGVLTLGVVMDRIKVEASVFRGREPDENRWGIESPDLDSHSFRLSVNPSERWALQASYGRIRSPEQLEPGVDQDRITASAMYDGKWGDTGRWEGTLAWGQNRNHPGHILDAYLAEGALEFAERHTLFARAEQVEKDELFAESDPRAGEALHVGELTGGYRYDFLRRHHTAFGLGVAGTLSHVPSELRSSYGGGTTGSGLVFAHLALH